MLFDTHVHYNLEPLFSNNEDWESDEIISPQHWKSHWQTAQENDVAKSIIVGTNVSTSFRAIQISKLEENLFSTVGLHPTEVNQFAIRINNGENEKKVLNDLNAEINKIEHLALHHPIVAIGEIGLDYYRLSTNQKQNDEIHKLQKYAFIEQLAIAKKLNLPMICHVRDKNNQAYSDVVEILQKEKPYKFVLHCISGPKEYVKEAIRLGGYAGFDGNITYPNAQNIREIFSLIPSDKILIETDAPFLPPQNFRGKICEPWMISKTAQFIQAELKGDINQINENAQRLFEL